jgi:hypothetical protein
MPTHVKNIELKELWKIQNISTYSKSGQKNKAYLENKQSIRLRGN